MSSLEWSTEHDPEITERSRMPNKESNREEQKQNAKKRVPERCRSRRLRKRAEHDKRKKKKIAPYTEAVEGLKGFQNFN